MRYRLTRWFLATACLCVSAKLMATALKISGFGAAGHLVISLSAMITAVVLIAPETTFRLAEWCSKFITDIIFPSEELKKPPLSYTLARRYRTEGRWHDAAEQYLTIILFYPDEREAYLELLEVAKQLDDNALYDKHLALFKKRFPVH